MMRFCSIDNEDVGRSAFDNFALDSCGKSHRQSPARRHTALPSRKGGHSSDLTGDSAECITGKLHGQYKHESGGRKVQGSAGKRMHLGEQFGCVVVSEDKTHLLHETPTIRILPEAGFVLTYQQFTHNLLQVVSPLILREASQLGIETEDLHAFDAGAVRAIAARQACRRESKWFQKGRLRSGMRDFPVPEQMASRSRNLAVVPVTFLNWHSL
jgi:hypothetical protein